MQTEADIANLALTYAGHAQFIDSLNDAGAEAQCCKVAYSSARDMLLARYPWPWATRHSALAELTDVARSPWQHAYALPADLLAPEVLVNPQWPWPPPLPFWCRAWEVRCGRAPTIPFALELSGDGAKQILLTNLQDAELLYVVRVESVLAMPALFQEALAFEVAVRLARSLVKDEAKARSLRGEAEVALGRAWAQAMNSQQPQPPPKSTFVLGRY